MRRYVLAAAGLLAYAGGVAGQGLPGSGWRSGSGSHQPYYLWMARSVVQRAPVAEDKWDYTGGLVLWAIEQVGQRAHDPALLAYVQRNIDRFVQPDGRIAVYDS
ncbi:MAG TPA: hypothetical protein VF832_15020, partial [Longimicrobiales bacterium]